jgi:hypothetical protein
MSSTDFSSPRSSSPVASNRAADSSSRLLSAAAYVTVSSLAVLVRPRSPRISLSDPTTWSDPVAFALVALVSRLLSCSRATRVPSHGGLPSPGASSNARISRTISYFAVPVGLLSAAAVLAKPALPKDTCTEGAIGVCRSFRINSTREFLITLFIHQVIVTPAIVLLAPLLAVSDGPYPSTIIALVLSFFTSLVLSASSWMTVPVAGSTSAILEASGLPVGWIAGAVLSGLIEALRWCWLKKWISNSPDNRSFAVLQSFSPVRLHEHGMDCSARGLTLRSIDC